MLKLTNITKNYLSGDKKGDTTAEPITQPPKQIEGEEKGQNQKQRYKLFHFFTPFPFGCFHYSTPALPCKGLSAVL